MEGGKRGHGPADRRAPRCAGARNAEGAAAPAQRNACRSPLQRDDAVWAALRARRPEAYGSSYPVRLITSHLPLGGRRTPERSEVLGLSPRPQLPPSHSPAGRRPEPGASVGDSRARAALTTCDRVSRSVRAVVPPAVDEERRGAGHAAEVGALHVLGGWRRTSRRRGRGAGRSRAACRGAACLGHRAAGPPAPASPRVRQGAGGPSSFPWLR